MKSKLSMSHDKLKQIRGRGEEIQSHLAAVCYIRSLESELATVQAEIHKAWLALDHPKEYRKFTRHADHAQQRLHQSIKKIARKFGKKKKD
jgi:hypothetical protein